ncbi:MFS transporter, partial [Anaerolineales bacterium HSG24]|nr:MFS transporter [Anaerolineales bacterium HSG24]
MKPTPLQLTFQIGIAALGRFLINTARRMIYPFASVLSVGLGVPLFYISSLIAINQATGLLSPLFGPLSDRWGYRKMMLLGLAILSFGMGFVGIFPFYGVLVVTMFLAGLGKSIYDPALQSYIGEHVPYQRRGLAIGLVEYSWAGSTLIGLPLIGLLLANQNFAWQTSFLVLGGLGLLALVGLA